MDPLDLLVESDIEPVLLFFSPLPSCISPTSPRALLPFPLIIICKQYPSGVGNIAGKKRNEWPRKVDPALIEFRFSFIAITLLSIKTFINSISSGKASERAIGRVSGSAIDYSFVLLFTSEAIAAAGETT
jgi:hypothetical protein